MLSIIFNPLMMDTNAIHDIAEQTLKQQTQRNQKTEDLYSKKSFEEDCKSGQSDISISKQLNPSRFGSHVTALGP